jgi:aspartyl-tRNA(Asn)/glutamyl-tRNA(Gln) amidotransferase subunit A
MSIPTYYTSLTQLSDAISKREISPVELARCYVERIEAIDGHLNAYRLPTPERAMDEAEAAQKLLERGQSLGPLHGIPYAAKDLYDVAGLPTSAGARVLENNMAQSDSDTVARLRRAGMVLLGKTNTVQFAYGGVGINHDHGTPHNPWHEEARAPGGSSSGSGVAVAAGMAPVALGTDTGGSVRIPSALCGLSGLKTTVGRVSRSGVYPLSWSLDSVGPLARTVRDAALVYDAINGEEPGDSSTQGIKAHRVSPALDGDIRGMRVGIARTAFFDGVDSEIVDAVNATAAVFATRGAVVQDVEFEPAARALGLNPGGLIIAAEAYMLNRTLVDEQFDALDPAISNRVIKGRDVAAHDYLANIRKWDALRAEAVHLMRDIDVLICPSSRWTGQPIAMIDASTEAYGEYNLGYLRNSSIGNILNLCGLSVPCGFDVDGMPIGLMIYAKPFDEVTALRAGHAYQCETDWHERTPSLDWL